MHTPLGLERWCCQLRQGEIVEHFGVKVIEGPKNGLRLKRENYARINKRNSTKIDRDEMPNLWAASAFMYEDDDHIFYTDEFCERYQRDALLNFDLNMAFFEGLERDEFERAVQAGVDSQRGMVEVTDLKQWDGVAGVYVMVLDGYKQAYVGQAGDSTGIMKRIRQHWSTSKPFDRLLFGDVETSIMPIDAFRALDTTRIFAAKVRNPWAAETKLEASIPNRFLLNRLMGGESKLVGMAAALGADVLRMRRLGEAVTSVE